MDWKLWNHGPKKTNKTFLPFQLIYPGILSLLRNANRSYKSDCPFLLLFFSSLPIFILPWNTTCVSQPLRSFWEEVVIKLMKCYLLASQAMAWERARSTGPLTCPLSALPSSHNVPSASSGVFSPSRSSWSCSRWDETQGEMNRRSYSIQTLESLRKSKNT